MNIELGQIFSQVIAFLIVLWILKRYAWKPLLKLLEERRERIRFELDSIEKEKKEVASLRSSYEEKLKKIDAAAKEQAQVEIFKARHEARKIEEEANKRARSIINQASKTAELEEKRALDYLKDDIVELTLTATEVVLKKELSKEQNKQLIAQCIEEVQRNENTIPRS